MSTATSIEWTDVTWNPVRGCSRVSAGCDHCYAMRQARRQDRPGGAYEGLTRVGSRGGDWSGVVRLVPEALDQPLRWRKRRRVFVNSMSDLFHESLPDEAIDRVFLAMAVAARHTFQVLTKRPERMRRYVSDVAAFPRILELLVAEDPGAVARVTHRNDGLTGFQLRNVWLGVSIEDQRTADERIPILLETPAAVRFVSAEPLLGPVDLDRCHWLDGDPELDWVIVGGESGPGARPCDAGWIRSVVHQCWGTGIPCFVKQLGAAYRGAGTAASPLRLRDRKGGDPSEWPEDLRVRQFPRA